MKRARGQNIVWTPEHDDYLVRTHRSLTAMAQAEKLGKPYPTIIWHRHQLFAQGRITFHERIYHRRWSEQDTDYLYEHYSDRSIAALCRRLRRTRTAVMLKKKRLGLRRIDGFFTARMLAQLFSVDSHVVAWWVEQGWLRGTKAPYKQGLHSPWVFHEKEVRELIQERPWLFQHTRMERHLFKSLVMEQWELDPWYTTADAARRFGVSGQYIRGVAHRGDIQTFQRQPEKKWSVRYVRKSEMERWMAIRSSLWRGRNRQARREGLWRKGRPSIVATIWRVRCPRCDQPFQVHAPPRMWGPQVMREFGDSHQCEKAAEIGKEALWP